MENSTYSRASLKRRLYASGLKQRSCELCGRRVPRPERRKVPRPTYEQLKEDLSHMSWLAVGRKYGVSDNAVRKWVRWYERDAEAEAA